MIYAVRIKDAITLALRVHQVDQKQIRKGKPDMPYIIHPLTAGLLLARADASEDVVVAGILHDTVEDSIDGKKITIEMLQQQFGSNVAELVESVTEKRKDLPWEERKNEALEHIKTFSHDSLLVKSADLISNVSDILDDYKKDGAATFGRFNAPGKTVVRHYCDAMKAVLARWPEIPFAEDLKMLGGEMEKIEGAV